MILRLLILLVALGAVAGCTPVPVHHVEPADENVVYVDRPRWKRHAKCPACDEMTEQVLHGCTADGVLWKKHLCACKGWHCLQCDEVHDKLSGCCR